MTAVLMFAKAPRPGYVKTRLAAEVGAEEATRVYRAIGRSVAGHIGRTHQLAVWYDPPGALREMRDWLGEGDYHPQPDGDLGARVQEAFAEHFARGDRPVIAIGADAPGVTSEIVRRAEKALSRADVVLGPATDGGYYLIGLNRPVPALFERIPWGTSDVLQVTLEICNRLHLRSVQLGSLRDLDTAADLAAIRREQGCLRF